VHDEWTELVMPLYAEDDNDALGRQRGELLWDRFKETDFPSVERGEISSRSFAALYQQRPVPMDGGLIKGAWLEHRYSVIPDDLRIIMALDAAAKTGLANDYSALVVLGCDKTSFLIRDVIRGRWDFPDLRNAVLMAHAKHHPSTIYIEDASNGTSLVQTLKAETLLPIVPVTARGSKISRVEAQTGLLESGRVLLPDERKIAAPWLLEFERELLAFPGGKYDDQVDALALALSQARNERLDIPLFFAALRNSNYPWRS
jgi:predicted phage terminase large subunit-like protein